MEKAADIFLEMHYHCKLIAALSLKARAGEYGRGTNHLVIVFLGSLEVESCAGLEASPLCTLI